MLEKLRNIHCTLLISDVYKLLFIITSVICLASISIAQFEGLSIPDSIWWTIVTMTTIGYGDISPKTTEGRAVAVFVMLCGISVICILTGKIAELMVYSRIRKMTGITNSKLRNHIIICNWNGRTADIIRNIKNAKKHSRSNVVVIADKADEAFLVRENVQYYKGVINDASLRAVCLEYADTVIVLGDSTLEHSARDAKCVLDTLMIESINPNVYTIVELVDNHNEEYCKRAHADEVISGFTIGGNLIAQTALNHGMSRVVSDILSNTSGTSLSIIPCPDILNNMSFIDAIVVAKQSLQVVLLGVSDIIEGTVQLNPNKTRVLDSKIDKLVVLHDAI